MKLEGNEKPIPVRIYMTGILRDLAVLERSLICYWRPEIKLFCLGIFCLDPDSVGWKNSSQPPEALRISHFHQTKQEFASSPDQTSYCQLV